MKELRPGVYPYKNFYFVESDGVVIEGKDLTTLVNAVWGYRRRAGLLEGDAFAEVQAQICSRTPGDCQEVETLNRQPVADDKEFQGRVSARAAELLDLRMRKELKFVSRAESDCRADKCLSCPLCSKLPDCAPCQQNLSMLLSAVAQPSIPHERLDGKACKLSGSPLSVEVMLDGQPFLNEAPLHCWRKGEGDL